MNVKPLDMYEQNSIYLCKRYVNVQLLIPQILSWTKSIDNNNSIDNYINIKYKKDKRETEIEKEKTLTKPSMIEKFLIN